VNTPLCKIVLPGSHDAGVYGNAVVTETKHPHQEATQELGRGQGKAPVHTRWCQADWAVCQHTNLKGQARSGSRFFDLRIYVKDEWLRPTNMLQGKLVKKDLRAGHYTAFEGYSWKEPSLGAYGGSLISLIKDAVEFVKAYTSEFLILRFSHVKNHKKVRNGIKAQLDAMNAFGEDRVYLGGDNNLGAKTVQDLRGKVVMVFDSQFNSVREFLHGSWMVPWSKLEQNQNTTGLHTCGFFADNKDINVVQPRQTAAVDDHVTNCLHNNTSPSHLCFVYWQQTGGAGKLNVKKMTTAPQNSAHSELPQFVNDLMEQWGESDQKKSGQPPANVISHDFVQPDTCERIIKMNRDLWTNAEQAAYTRGKARRPVNAG
jgi:hypothetical protein